MKSNVLLLINVKINFEKIINFYHFILPEKYFTIQDLLFIVGLPALSLHLP